MQKHLLLKAMQFVQNRKWKTQGKTSEFNGTENQFPKNQKNIKWD